MQLWLRSLQHNAIKTEKIEVNNARYQIHVIQFTRVIIMNEWMRRINDNKFSKLPETLPLVEKIDRHERGERVKLSKGKLKLEVNQWWSVCSRAFCPNLLRQSNRIHEYYDSDLAAAAAATVSNVPTMWFDEGGIFIWLNFPTKLHLYVKSWNLEETFLLDSFTTEYALNVWTPSNIWSRPKNDSRIIK